MAPGIDAEDIVNRIQEETYDELGEIAEDYLSHVKESQINDLQVGLEEVYSKWLEDNKFESNFFRIEDEETIYLNQYKRREKYDY